MRQACGHPSRALLLLGSGLLWLVAWRFACAIFAPEKAWVVRATGGYLEGIQFFSGLFIVVLQVFYVMLKLRYMEVSPDSYWLRRFRSRGLMNHFFFLFQSASVLFLATILSVAAARFHPSLLPVAVALYAIGSIHMVLLAINAHLITTFARDFPTG